MVNFWMQNRRQNTANEYLNSLKKESATHQVKDTVASSTIGNEVHQDIACDRDEDGRKDGNSLP